MKKHGVSTAARYESTRRQIRAFARRHDLQTVVLLCLPAVLVAIVLRGYLLWHYPAAFTHNDTASTLETAHHLIAKVAFATEGKKTPLVPAIYCIPALLGIPILAFAAVVQHALGVLLVLVCGLLVRAWFHHWRTFVIPVTSVIAVHPILLWYEHVALAETYAVFAATTVALSGWLFWKIPNRWTLVSFFVALFFVATSRPEGNLFAFFGIALVARVYWRQWRTLAVAFAAIFAWAIFLFAFTKTSQSGTLLFASVVHLTPNQLWFSPGIAEAVAPVVNSSREEWQSKEIPGLVSVRKDLQNAIESELVAQGLPRREARKEVDSICKRAGLETLLRNAMAIPAFALRKFVIAHYELPAIGYNEYAVSGQTEVLFDVGEPQKGLRTSDLSWGTKFTNSFDAEEYFRRTTTPIPGDWLWVFLERFQAATILPIFPVALPGSDVRGVPIRGIPWLYTCALLGLLTLAIRNPIPLNFHQLFGLFLIAFFVIIMITANVRARFRFVFEPFWILYATALIDSLWCLLDRAIARESRPSFPAD